jgi:hypothetical protein
MAHTEAGRESTGCSDDESESIRVAIRIRPLTEGEKCDGECITVFILYKPTLTDTLVTSLIFSIQVLNKSTIILRNGRYAHFESMMINISNLYYLSPDTLLSGYSSTRSSTPFSPRGVRSDEGTTEQYVFDTVWDGTTGQDEVFSEVSSLVDSAFYGYNATIFAYGPSGEIVIRTRKRYAA